jgi:oligopeptidase B
MFPPVAKKIAYKRTIHNHIISDDYHWLRDTNWPKVNNKEILNYLKAENKYTEGFFQPHKKFQDKLYKELIGRIKLADRSVPIKKRNYYYFVETTKTSDYEIHLRKNAQGKTEVILDENKESKPYSYFNVCTISISPNDNLMAYSVDTTGDEHYTVYIKDLTSKKSLKDTLKNVLGSIVWDETSSGFYYTKVNDKWRANKLFYHKLGNKQSEDKLIYHEKDQTFRIGLEKSSDYKYIIVAISSSTSVELRHIKSDDLTNKLQMLIERRDDHLCSVDHFHHYFYIHTNDKGKNFRLVRVDDQDYKRSNYQELIPHSDKIYLTGVALYDHNLIIETKELGLPKIHIMDYDLKRKDSIDYPDPAYAASVIYSCHNDDGMMIGYSSMKSPASILKYDFKTKKIKTLKTQEIPSGYNKDEYASERILVPSREKNIKIPVSIVYKKSLFKKDGSNPLFLYGYGSYGISISPRFNTSIFSLLERGFVYAIAHVRGGDDLGFKWYESAKFLKKRRTFHDFIDIARHLVKHKYTSAGNIAIAGGSAGGMLVGNAVNEAPELFRAAIADVPFVDVLNTMLDDTLPLTPGEFKEWGNPKEKEYFHYIKSYSPYDNVKAQSYPNLYVLAGLNDPRVTYWEPAKWVAKLRDTKTDSNLLVLETDMDTGHGGKSGRFDKFKEVAKKYLFVLTVFGIKK